MHHFSNLVVRWNLKDCLILSDHPWLCYEIFVSFPELLLSLHLVQQVIDVDENLQVDLDVVILVLASALLYRWCSVTLRSNWLLDR